MRVGDIVATRSFGPITRTDIVRHAGAGGDFNPIHHDEAFAKAAGYPTVLVMGLYTAGLAGTAAAETIGPLALRRYGVRYVDQVWPGDTLTVTLREASAVEGRRGFTLTVDAQSEGAQPRLVLTGTAEADL